jgi:hypothetical protein
MNTLTLREFLQEHLIGGCRILSQGEGCRCPLCQLDKLERELAHWIKIAHDSEVSEERAERRAAKLQAAHAGLIKISAERTERLAEAEKVIDKAQAVRGELGDHDYKSHVTDKQITMCDSLVVYDAALARREQEN